MLIQHHPSHLNQSIILPFNHAILLKNTWGRKLILNTMVKAENIKEIVLELSAIIIVNYFQCTREFFEHSQSYALKV